MQSKSNFVCTSQSVIVYVDGGSLGRYVGMQAAVNKKKMLKSLSKSFVMLNVT